jgi:gliding motility-associated-like protein
VFAFDVKVELKYSVDVPSAFTPNADGLNDRLKVKGWGIKELVYFQIVNRFGAIVYESTDINEGWDGYTKGTLQEAGIYNYRVKVISYDNKVRTTQGAVELIK